MPNNDVMFMGESGRGLRKAIEAAQDESARMGHTFDADLEVAEGVAKAAVAAYVENRGFAELIADVRTVLDTHYPADIFVGRSPDADPGTKFVAKLREALAVLP